MPYFNFLRLISKYSTEFTLIIPVDDTVTYNDAGDAIKGGTEEKTMRGAIIGFKESKVFRAEGTLTAKDKHLFMLEPIENALDGVTVVYEGQKFNVEAETENAKFTGVYAYVLKYVSAFDLKDGEAE